MIKQSQQNMMLIQDEISSGLFLLSVIADIHDKIAFSSDTNSASHTVNDSHLTAVTTRRVSEECNDDGGVDSGVDNGPSSRHSLYKMPLKKRLKNCSWISSSNHAAKHEDGLVECPNPYFISRSESGSIEENSIFLSGTQPSPSQSSWEANVKNCKEFCKQELVEMYFSDKKTGENDSAKNKFNANARKRGRGKSDCKDEYGRDVTMGYFSMEPYTLAPLPPKQVEWKNTETAAVSEDHKKLRESASYTTFMRRQVMTQAPSRVKQYQDAALLMSRSSIVSTSRASKVSQSSLSPYSTTDTIVERFANEDTWRNWDVERPYQDAIFPIIPTTLNVLSKGSQKHV